MTEPIRLRYLLVLNIPVFKDRLGQCWTDRLWHKDLIGHVEYLEDFTLACPFIEVETASAELVRIADPRVKFVELPGRHKLSLRLPQTFYRLWRAVGRAQVVHTGLGGWLPISVCNLTLRMAHVRRRFCLLMVESSPWRLVPGRPASLRDRLRAVLSEWVNRRSIDRVDMAIFTHSHYMKSLMTRNLQRGFVIQASWIDESVILTEHEAAQTWTHKGPHDGGPLRLLFAGRLTAAKGVPVLIEAMKHLAGQAGIEVSLHIIGEGELREDCAAARSQVGAATLDLLDPVPYGTEFFRLLTRYHAVVVPSVTDEQPRIVYDAYSQAVPVLAADTVGLRECVQDMQTGRLAPANDPNALAELIAWAARHRESLAVMGMTSLAHARALTHREMHRKRWELLAARLAPAQ